MTTRTAIPRRRPVSFSRLAVPVLFLSLTALLVPFRFAPDQSLTAGLYLLHLRAGGRVETKRVVLRIPEGPAGGHTQNDV
ncbi:MAG: hypothetical protein KatS3mg042_0715 [Rhodothermaceae bacterium]|nr:MAG: hypothetical protein KatS3mg042_0715 [Rhodothermaceae bacterium]